MAKEINISIEDINDIAEIMDRERAKVLLRTSKEALVLLRDRIMDLERELKWAERDNRAPQMHHWTNLIAACHAGMQEPHHNTALDITHAVRTAMVNAAKADNGPHGRNK